MLGLELLILLVFLAALVAPLIPVRRRAGAAFPAVTVCLLTLNILVFAATSQEGELTRSIAESWGLVPSAPTLLALVTSVFLHGSWLHLAGNMLGLWLFGPHVEEALGRVEYVLFYIGCGVAASLLHLVMAATLLPGAASVPMVGASGAIFGILGLFAVRFYRARVRVFLVAQIPAVWAVGCFAALQVFYGVSELANPRSGDGTATWAHVGGFLFGMILAVPLRMREDGAQEYRLEDAESAASAGRLEQAAAHYRLALTETPGSPDTHRALARVCAGLGQSEAAFRHFNDALRLSLRAGNAPAAADVYAEARERFEAFPLPAPQLYRVASACEEAQQYALALLALSELCRDFPDAREAEIALFRMGKLHLSKLDQPQNALGIFAEFLRLYPRSEWQTHAERLLTEARRASQGRNPLPAAPG